MCLNIISVTVIFALQTAVSKYEATKQKRKFSSFFKSLVIELDKDLYGPDNHLVEVSSFVVQMHTVTVVSLLQA